MRKETIKNPAIVKTLPVPLTGEEKLFIGSKIAELECGLNKTELEKKTAVSAFNDAITAQSAEILALSRKLNSGVRETEVECYWVLDDPENGRKTLYRVDTSEAVETVNMTEQDSQLLIPFNPDSSNN